MRYRYRDDELSPTVGLRQHLTPKPGSSRHRRSFRPVAVADALGSSRPDKLALMDIPEPLALQCSDCVFPKREYRVRDKTPTARHQDDLTVPPGAQETVDRLGDGPERLFESR